jgi:hypothetical protein
MTQHHIDVGTVPHITKWHNITWMFRNTAGRFYGNLLLHTEN